VCFPYQGGPSDLPFPHRMELEYERQHPNWDREGEFDHTLPPPHPWMGIGAGKSLMNDWKRERNALNKIMSDWIDAKCAASGLNYHHTPTEGYYKVPPDLPFAPDRIFIGSGSDWGGAAEELIETFDDADVRSALLDRFRETSTTLEYDQGNSRIAADKLAFADLLAFALSRGPVTPSSPAGGEA